MLTKQDIASLEKILEKKVRQIVRDEISLESETIRNELSYEIQTSRAHLQERITSLDNRIKNIELNIKTITRDIKEMKSDIRNDSISRPKIHFKLSKFSISPQI